jgi:hypothetical protein
MVFSFEKLMKIYAFAQIIKACLSKVGMSLHVKFIEPHDRVVGTENTRRGETNN